MLHECASMVNRVQPLASFVAGESRVACAGPSSSEGAGTGNAAHVISAAHALCLKRRTRKSFIDSGMGSTSKLDLADDEQVVRGHMMLADASRTDACSRVAPNNEPSRCDREVSHLIGQPLPERRDLRVVFCAEPVHEVVTVLDLQPALGEQRHEATGG